MLTLFERGENCKLQNSWGVKCNSLEFCPNTCTRYNDPIKSTHFVTTSHTEGTTMHAEGATKAQARKT